MTQSTGFLSQLATDLYNRHGTGVSSLSMIFPSRRAGLFFGKALGEIIDKPLWQPPQTTIGELMEELSGLRTGERLRLVTELYKIYSEFHPGETFDKFYFWGELLLGDFDSVDKYLVDADTFFSNLVDMHELDDRFDYLSDDQKAVILKFWSSFGGADGRENHSIKSSFLKLWHTLGPIYHRFRARLSELGIAYEGMVYREAAERILTDRVPQIPDRQYIIAGFNALSKCERVLFEWLQKNGKADFYWDWDHYFVDDPEQEAGRFMRDNLRRFPSAGTLSGGHKNFEKPKRIRSISTASDVVQCKFAGQILEELAHNNPDKPGLDTAIVLADENLLTPLLYSLPQSVTHLNITMGYPLRMHPAYTFVERELVKNLRLSTDWRTVSDGLAEAVSQKADDTTDDEQFFALISDHLRALSASLEACEIALEPKTYALLLRRSLQSVRIPFEGEPLEGVQIMGILETRALDFDNIIFLSCGDSTMPGDLTGAPSLIPYNLKMAYGLPTPEHHEGVWAYHFFRLMSRAGRVDMLWPSVSDERSTGEVSRYIRQLDYESPHCIEHRSVTVDVDLSPDESVVVEKSAEVMQRLGELSFSPSSFFSYVECPLKFYFSAVAGLRAPREDVEGVDGALFGTIFHAAMQRLYAPLVGVGDPRERIRAIIGSGKVQRAVAEAITEAGETTDSGAVKLAGRTIEEYIERAVLPFDAGRNDSFVIEALEYGVEAKMGGVVFRGRIDRLDRLSDGTLRVVDYKTGSPKAPASDGAVFQIRLYAMMLGGNAVPALYFVRDLSADLLRNASSPDEFESQLHSIIDELFDARVPFVQCAVSATAPCTYCDFAPVCRRA